MPFAIPLRIMTSLIGILLGYATGTYIELLYKKSPRYREEIESLLQGAQPTLGFFIDSQECLSSDDDIDNLLIDSSDTSTTSESDCEEE